MTAPADLVLTGAEVHTLAPPADSPWGDGPGDETYEAVAVRDGEVVGLGRAYDVAFLAGVETEVLDLDGRVVLPGFVDAHTHLTATAEYLVHADLSGAGSAGAAVETLRAEAAETRRAEGREDGEWLLGFGWDESDWPEDRYLRRDDLDRVSGERPVAAVRVDMHTAALNSVALERLRGEVDPANVRTAGGGPPGESDSRQGSGDGRPTGVVVEGAVDAIWADVDRGVAGTRELVTAARDRAHEQGVTCVHDKPDGGLVPRACRDLDRAGELDLRVRLDYRDDLLDAVLDAGLATNAGGAFVRVGGIKSFADGSFGGRTARLTEPYADAAGGEQTGSDAGSRTASGDGDATGQWLAPPEDLRALVERVDDAGLQSVTHAIGDAAIEEVLSAYEGLEDPDGARHRIEHAELASDGHIDRMADAGVVASCQPNFLRWAGEGGLYEQRLGERWRDTNRFRDLLDAGVPLAFGSDSMPLGPLEGVHRAVNAPDPSQRLGVTEALRAYTLGGAYAGFDEDRLGTVEVGKRADLVVLDASPWESEESIRDVDVVLTVVDGRVVYDGR